MKYLEPRNLCFVPKKLPHLIIVSTNSSIDKWEKEFKKWCPAPDDFKVLSYYGSRDDRRNSRQKIQEHEYDVILTTQAMVTGIPADRNFFSKLKFDYVIFAQGRGKWPLKWFEILKEIKFKKKLLLTSNDPRQYKNLVEIMPLLYYCLPKSFDLESFDGKMNMLRLRNILLMYPSPKLNERNEGSFEDGLVKTAKIIVEPFLLRRLKSNVKNELRDFPWSIVDACNLFPPLKNVSLDYNKLVSYELFKDTYQSDIREKNPDIPESDDCLEILMKAKWREFKASGTSGGSGRFSNSSLNKEGGYTLFGG